VRALVDRDQALAACRSPAPSREGRADGRGDDAVSWGPAAKLWLSREAGEVRRLLRRGWRLSAGAGRGRAASRVKSGRGGGCQFFGRMVFSFPPVAENRQRPTIR
jgi:hypothetical protein